MNKETKTRIQAGLSPANDRNEPLLVREWDADVFHQRVLQLEKDGYVARLETYRVTAEVNPDTGEIIHLHTIEMYPPSLEGS